MATPDPAGGSGHGRTPEAPAPLPIAVVDNHTHLDIARDGEPAVDVASAVAQAKAVGVDRLVQIGCDLPGARFTVEMIDLHPAMLGGVALHPNEAPRLAAEGGLDAAYAEIEELAAHPRVRVIGETGLDYFRTGPDGVGVQQDSFRWHIDLAKRTGKALQIHDRDAHEDVSMARTCADRGYYLSFAGTVTFKNARGLRDALSVTPLERVLVETDAPYLTPAPWRGATNSPYLVPLTVRAMAGTLGVAVPTLCQAISANSEAVYGPW
jgi:TatD DNase family protein